MTRATSSSLLAQEDPQPPARRAVRRVLGVSGGTVPFCGWDGVEPHHVHAVHKIASGAVVLEGDDVPPGALGGYVGHHWYRRVGEKCLPARGDGTLYDEPVRLTDEDRTVRTSRFARRLPISSAP